MICDQIGSLRGFRNREHETNSVGSFRDGEKSSCQAADRPSCRCNRTTWPRCPKFVSRFCGLQSRESSHCQAAPCPEVCFPRVKASPLGSQDPFPPGLQNRIPDRPKMSSPTSINSQLDGRGMYSELLHCKSLSTDL